MIRRILVGLGDAKYSESATRMAIEIAQAHNAQLTGISVLDVDRVRDVGAVPIGGGYHAANLREHRLEKTGQVIEEVNQRFATLCGEAGIAYAVEKSLGDPYWILAELARYHDLVVCGLNSLFEHGVIEEPPDELVWLIQSGVRPILAVTHEYRPIDRVLIAYSGSMESAKVMKRYVQLRLWPQAATRIVTFEHKAELAIEFLAKAAEYCSAHDLAVDTEYVAKSPIHGLLAYAESWNPGLIVLGNSSRNLLLRHVFGETMLHTVRHSDRPLFLAQ